MVCTVSHNTKQFRQDALSGGGASESAHSCCHPHRFRSKRLIESRDLVLRFSDCRYHPSLRATGLVATSRQSDCSYPAPDRLQCHHSDRLSAAPEFGPQPSCPDSTRSPAARHRDRDIQLHFFITWSGRLGQLLLMVSHQRSIVFSVLQDKCRLLQFIAVRHRTTVVPSGPCTMTVRYPARFLSQQFNGCHPMGSPVAIASRILLQLRSCRPGPLSSGLHARDYRAGVIPNLLRSSA